MPVMTVRGPVADDRLGLTLAHEHLFLDLFRGTRVRDGLLNHETLVTDEAARVKAAGGGTLRLPVWNYDAGHGVPILGPPVTR